MSKWFSIGAGLAALGVMAGAFGAHALKAMLDPERLLTWETAARYQLYVALALLAAGAAPPNARLDLGCRLLLLGALIFSGSLYLLCLSGIKLLGAVTPLGGLAMIAGFVCLALSRKGDSHA